MAEYHRLAESEWPQWRERALATLRAMIEGQKKQAKRSKTYWHRRDIDHSELVRVFLWEKKYDEAWREAQAGGCSDDLWMPLAALREKEHPEDALSIYKGRIAPLVEMTNNTAYQEAIEILRKVRKLMTRLDRGAEFDDYLAALRVEYKRKRNFIKLFDAIE